MQTLNKVAEPHSDPVNCPVKGAHNETLNWAQGSHLSWGTDRLNKHKGFEKISPLFPLQTAHTQKKKNLTVDFTSTPAEASNTATAPSRTLKQRSTSTVKSTWPKKPTFLLLHHNSNRQHQQVIIYLNNFFFFQVMSKQLFLYLQGNTPINL